MAVQLNEQGESNVVEVTASGKLTDEDYRRLVPAFDRLVHQHGKLRVLFNMVDFHGWNMSALWDDIKFDLKHFSDIEMLAMVGDKAWEKGMSVFCRPFTTAKVRYFDRSAIDEARAWLLERA